MANSVGPRVQEPMGAPVTITNFADTLQTNRHKNKLLRVENLHYEVDEKGMEWWERMANFQMPFDVCDKGASSRKRILNDVSFQVKSGEMLAVLGSSGSGKTSLLDVISCQNNGGEVTGMVTINNEKRTPDLIKSCSAYVRQNDRLLPHLTVRETLMFVAQLKLPKEWTYRELEQRVDSVIAELGLRHVTEVKVGGAEVRGISGGERRRVSIGLQLLIDPSILFLDEPTSGLDSFTAHHLVETLEKLARNNRIVLLSIHQPRSDIFELFDLMMLMSQGDMVYFGKANQMIDYFSDLGYPCPRLTNPCDYYVDLTTVDMKSQDTENTTRETVEMLAERYKDYMKNKDDNDKFNSKNTNPNTAQEQCSCDVVNEMSTNNDSCAYENRAYEPDVDSTGVVLDPPYISDDPVPVPANVIAATQSPDSALVHHKVGKLQQFNILFRRALCNNLEDYSFLGVQAIEAVAMSLMIGLVFFGLKMDQTSVRDRFGLLYIISALYPYMVILDVVGQYHRERNIIYFELEDNLYSAIPYFFSKIASELPEHTVFVILYGTPVYFMAGLQEDPSLFFTYLAMSYAIVYCSRSLALASSAFMPTFQMSAILAQACFTFALLSSGFIFNLDNIFIGIRWVSYISYLKWGFQGMCTTEFAGMNFTCDTDLPIGCIHTGEEALEVYSLGGFEAWHSALVIVAEIFFFLGLFFVGLRFVSQKPHQQ